MKRTMRGLFCCCVSLTVSAGFGQQTCVFFRIVAPTNTMITALGSDGTLAWTNAATVGVTCTVQRATTLVGPSNWVDYVRHSVTNRTMASRLFDPNPPAGMVLIPAGMVLIPAGMNSGTDPDFGAYALTVDAFYMDATEVTKAQWDAVYSWAVTNGYSFFHAGSGNAANHPVHTVSWLDCVKWCNARSQKEGRMPCYYAGLACNFAANGYRLPTSTEWEYAARGGLSGRRFPWGDTITHSQANYYSDGAYSYDVSPTRKYHQTFATGVSPYTSPAGAFAPNGYGLYDMAGNVMEWCNDSSGLYRNVHGGSWFGNAFFVRIGFGDWYYLNTAVYDQGFRTVCR